MGIDPTHLLQCILNELARGKPDRRKIALLLIGLQHSITHDGKLPQVDIIGFNAYQIGRLPQ